MIIGPLPRLIKKVNFKYKVKAPSHVGPFEMQVHFEGSSEWESKIFFNITVTPSTNSRDNQENRNRLKYHTRLRNTSLSVFAGTMKKDGRFTKTKEFKPGELVTFQVSLFDNDEHKPISGQKGIMLILYGEDAKKVTNPLPPTDNNGNTYASIRAASKPSDGCIFKASYPGDSVYANADSKVQSYSVKY